MTKKFFITFTAFFLITLNNIFIFSKTFSAKKNKLIYLHEQKMRTIEDSKLNTFIKNGNVILIFYEDWCGPCKRMTPVFEQLVEEINNVLFIKIKRSLYKELFNRLRLTTVPAMVFFKKGKVVHIRPRSATKEELMELIKHYFKA